MAIVIDLIRKGAAPLRVAVTGSCRIQQPIEHLVSTGRAAYAAHGSMYPVFMHSPLETAQHIAICRGKLDIPDVYSPYIFSTPQMAEDRKSVV